MILRAASLEKASKRRRASPPQH